MTHDGERMNDVKTALLVDDNDELRSATREYLEEMGYEVTTAADAEQALRIAPDPGIVPPVPPRGNGFDLLVSDVYMPGMNGIELADRLLSRRPELAVLLFSSRGGEPEVRRRLARGDVAFLAKPFSPEELASRVGEAMGRVSARGGETIPEAVPAAAVEEPRVPASPKPRWPKGMRAVGAVVLVLGLGALIRGFELGPPPLPAPDPGNVTRSARIEVVQPLGPLTSGPAELVWLPIAGAGSYAVSLRTIDGKALWQTEVAGSPAEVPAEIEGALHRAVTYYWSVEALDDKRGLLARSELAPFVIELAPRESPPL